MALHEVLQQGPFQQRAVAGIDPFPAAAELRAARIVDQAQAFRQIHVVFGCESKLRALPPGMEHLVVFLAAGHDVRVRQIGQDSQKGVHLRAQRVGLRVQVLDELPDLLDLRENGLHILPGLFHLRDLRGQGVPASLELIGLGRQSTPLGVPLQPLLKADRAALAGQQIFHNLRLFANTVDIQHAFIPPLTFLAVRRDKRFGRNAMHSYSPLV